MCVYVYICVCIQIFLWIWWSANILFLVFAHFFSFKCCISFFFSYSVHYQYLWLFLVPITVTADFFCVTIHFWFPFSDFFIDCSLFVFYSSILGMNLFGCKFCRILSSGRRKCDRKNFDSLLWAIVTVFQVLLAPWALLTPINPFCKSFPLPLPCMLINIVPPPPPPPLHGWNLVPFLVDVLSGVAISISILYIVWIEYCSTLLSLLVLACRAVYCKHLISFLSFVQSFIWVWSF